MSHSFAVFKQIHPNTPMPYRIVEKFNTSDGIRSRICDGAWSSDIAVMQEVERREAEAPSP